MSERPSDRAPVPRAPTPGDVAPTTASRAVIVRELERRLLLLENAAESTFGRFTALDWVVCVIAFVVLPSLLVWWGARR